MLLGHLGHRGGQLKNQSSVGKVHTEPVWGKSCPDQTHACVIMVSSVSFPGRGCGSWSPRHPVVL